jgi:ribosome-binding factor A
MVRNTTPGRRAERLAESIYQEVAEMLLGEMKDPRIGFTTVTRVELSPDLRCARVAVSVMGSAEEQQRTLEGLASAKSFVRREVAQRMGLKRAPEIHFVMDAGIQESLKIEGLLDKLKQEP